MGAPALVRQGQEDGGSRYQRAGRNCEREGHLRDSFERRRCLIPADGFYEWERKEKGKLPHYIYAADGSPLALAGLWSSWADPETGERLRTCTIITGRPNDRRGGSAPRPDRWLDGRQRDPEVVRAVLDEVTSPEMGEHAVSTLVNKVQNNVPELIVRLETPAVDA